MSTETTNKKKVDMDPKYLAKLSIILLIISAISAGLLAAVNGLTAPKIAAINEQKIIEAKQAVLTEPEGKDFAPVELTDDMLAIASTHAAAALLSLDEVVGADGFAGYVAEVEIAGYQPGIDLIIGLDADAAVTGISIVSMSETSGLGTKAKEADWLAQFIGGTDLFAVNKDGGTIQALTGATVTSRAVANAVNAVLDVVATLG